MRCTLTAAEPLLRSSLLPRPTAEGSSADRLSVRPAHAQPAKIRITPSVDRGWMPDLTRMQADDLRARYNQLRERYDAFAKRGLKLNLTRGKPSAQQLDLCNELLSLPGPRKLHGGRRRSSATTASCRVCRSCARSWRRYSA